LYKLINYNLMYVYILNYDLNKVLLSS
jgi:hypothetical protein